MPEHTVAVDEKTGAVRWNLDVVDRLESARKKTEAKWLGEEFGSGLSIVSIVESDPNPVNEAEMQDAMEFYAGDQWENGIKNKRLLNGRPCITVNRIPELVTHAVQASREKSEVYTKVQFDTAVAIIVRRNKSAQWLYNYVASTMAEVAQTAGGGR